METSGGGQAEGIVDGDEATSDPRLDGPSIGHAREPDPADMGALVVPVTDRVFLNLLVILTGVVIAYGASVLVSLLREGMPWESWSSWQAYVAWLGVTLLATLTFVAQAVESSRANLIPTVSLILFAIAIGVSEVVAYGAVDPASRPASTETAGWFLAAAATDLLVVAFIWVVLRQADSKEIRLVTIPQADRPKVFRDLKGAGGHAALAMTCWAIARSGAVGIAGVVGLTAMVALVLLAPLYDQQRRIMQAVQEAYRRAEANAGARGVGDG